MELGARELLQFLLVVATIAGSFQVVRSQLTRVIQDLEKTIKEISTIHDRIDKVEANPAVLHHQAQVLANINNPKVLDEHSRSHARLDADVGNIKKDIKALHNMHNGSHPPTR